MNSTEKLKREAHENLFRQSIKSACVDRIGTDIAKLEIHFDLRLTKPEIKWDLRGKSAGKHEWRYQDGFVRSKIRLNLDIAIEQPEDFLATVPGHEVAHFAARHVFGDKIKPHGPEWKECMKVIGQEPHIYHDMRYKPARKARKFLIECPSCGHEHIVGTVRRNRLIRGERHYFCSECNRKLGIPDVSEILN